MVLLRKTKEQLAPFGCAIEAFVFVQQKGTNVNDFYKNFVFFFNYQKQKQAETKNPCF